jgi:hypothetical protein
MKLLKRWWVSSTWIIVLTILIVISLLLKLLSLFEALQILITFTLVIITAQYAISTQKMVDEMKLTREAQSQPAIIAYFDNPTSNLLDLVIRNIGLGAAREVKLKITPPLLDHYGRDISELSLFKNGINFFPPNREFREIIGTSLQFFAEDSKRALNYTLTISFLNAEGKEIPPNAINLNLSVLRHLPIARESDLSKLTKEIKNLTDNLRGV